MSSKRRQRGWARSLATWLGFAIAASAVHAASTRSICVLPVPDGGDRAPSKANAEGSIVRVGQGFVDVAPRSRRVVHVRYTGETQFYSAFGGDYDPGELAVGQHVAVWFVGCRPDGNGSGRAAYLQLYSKDPADQPPETWLGGRVRR